MCGARIGCIVSKNKAVIQTALKFAQARLSPPTFAQIASEAALETPQSYFDDVIEEYVDRRNILMAELNVITSYSIHYTKLYEGSVIRTDQQGMAICFDKRHKITPYLKDD